jgi:hypothetical protein
VSEVVVAALLGLELVVSIEQVAGVEDTYPVVARQELEP